MKLKKSTDTASAAMPETLAPLPGVDLGAMATADQPSGMSKIAAALALVCTLASIVMLGLVAWMMYMNLELIQDAQSSRTVA